MNCLLNASLGEPSGVLATTYLVSGRRTSYESKTYHHTTNFPYSEEHAFEEIEKARVAARLIFDMIDLLT